MGDRFHKFEHMFEPFGERSISQSILEAGVVLAESRKTAAGNFKVLLEGAGHRLLEPEARQSLPASNPVIEFGANRRHRVPLRAVSWSFDALKRYGRRIKKRCLRKGNGKVALSASTDCSKTCVRTTELHSAKKSPLILSVIEAGSNPVGASKGGRGEKVKTRGVFQRDVGAKCQKVPSRLPLMAP